MENNMKKEIAFKSAMVAAILAAALSFNACGGSSSKTGSVAVPAAKSVTVTKAPVTASPVVQPGTAAQPSQSSASAPAAGTTQTQNPSGPQAGTSASGTTKAQSSVKATAATKATTASGASSAKKATASTKASVPANGTSKTIN